MYMSEAEAGSLTNTIQYNISSTTVTYGNGHEDTQPMKVFNSYLVKVIERIRNK